MSSDTPARSGIVWRVAPWCSVLAGVVVFFNAIRTTFSRDDLLQRSMALGGFPAPRGVLDMYDFVRANERAAFVASGALPWWTADDLSVRFFRPLTSAMLCFEHRFIGSPHVMHLHSLAWWAAAVLCASRLFRRVLTERAAAIATLVFAIAPCHALSLANVAQREVLVGATLGLLALTAICDERKWTAGFLFAATCASGEYGLCLGGYVLAMAVIKRDARVAVPFAIPAVIYLIMRSALGYGATGTGFYRDPLHAPWLFATHAPRSFLVLVADAWSTFDATTWSSWVLLPVLLATLFITRATSGDERWLAAGSFLAFLPLVASAPGVRLIGPAMIGVAAMIGGVSDRALTTRRATTVLVGAVLVGIQLVHGAFASWTSSTAFYKRGKEVERRAASLAEHLAGHDDGVVIVALGSWEAAFFGEVCGGAAPPREPWRVLVTARHALMLRVDRRTVDILVPKGQGFFPVGADDIFRSEDSGLHVGDERDVPDMHVVVVSDGTSSPPRMRFTFTHDLDDASFVWLTESVDHYRTTPPPVAAFGAPLSP